MNKQEALSVDYCEKYMGKFPVISVTLKGVSTLDFAGAKAMLRTIIGNESMRFIRMATPGIRREIEALVAGETVTHHIRQELTYRELYDSIDNLWSVLFTTGYLTQRGTKGADTYRLAIPN